MYGSRWRQSSRLIVRTVDYQCRYDKQSIDSLLLTKSETSWPSDSSVVGVTLVSQVFGSQRRGRQVRTSTASEPPLCDIMSEVIPISAVSIMCEGDQLAVRCQTIIYFRHVHVKRLLVVQRVCYRKCEPSSHVHIVFPMSRGFGVLQQPGATLLARYWI